MGFINGIIMNKINELVKQKFWNYDPRQKEKLNINTKVHHNDQHSYLFLFENLIATNDIQNKVLHINFKGYTTKITKNRLNAVLSEINQYIRYYKGMPLLNDCNFIPTNEICKIHYERLPI